MCRVFKDPNEREDFCWGSQCNRQSLRRTDKSVFPLSMLIRHISFLFIFPTVFCSALNESNAAWKTKVSSCGCRSPGNMDRPMNTQSNCSCLRAFLVALALFPEASL